MGFADFTNKQVDIMNKLHITQQVSKKLSSGDVSGLDQNGDGKNEINRVYSDDGKSIFENFDFDSDGAIDYARYLDEDGNITDEFKYDQNFLQKVLSFLGIDTGEGKQADELAAKLNEQKS